MSTTSSIVNDEYILALVARCVLTDELPVATEVTYAGFTMRTTGDQVYFEIPKGGDMNGINVLYTHLSYLKAIGIHINRSVNFPTSCVIVNEAVKSSAMCFGPDRVSAIEALTSGSLYEPVLELLDKWCNESKSDKRIDLLGLTSHVKTRHKVNLKEIGIVCNHDDNDVIEFFIAVRNYLCRLYEFADTSKHSGEITVHKNVLGRICTHAGKLYGSVDPIILDYVGGEEYWK